MYQYVNVCKAYKRMAAPFLEKRTNVQGQKYMYLIN